MKYALLLILLLNISAIAERKVRPLGPKVDVYIQPGIFAAPYEVIKSTTDRARRLMSRLTNVSIRVDIHTSPVPGCLGIGNNFYYNDESDIEFYCLWRLADRSGFLENDRIAYFITQPLVPRNGFHFLIGGFAWLGCYNNLHPNNSVGGVGVGNFLDYQVDGTTRVPPSLAIIMHEWGHLMFKLTHDGEETEYLMNTLFNALKISSRVPPHLWRLSPKSKKQAKKCINHKAKK